MNSFIKKFLQFAPNCSQLLDGWHQDGTAWTEWDESVRKELTELHKEALALDHPKPVEKGCGRCRALDLVIAEKEKLLGQAGCELILAGSGLDAKTRRIEFLERENATIRGGNEEKRNQIKTLEAENEKLRKRDYADYVHIGEHTKLMDALGKAREALKSLYSELVESNSPRCDEWSTPALIIKKALNQIQGEVGE